MSKKLKSSSIQPNRFWMMSIIACIALIATACGSSTVTPAIPTVDSGNILPTLQAAAVPTQVSAPAGASANTADACTLLSKDDVSNVLGVPVLTVVLSGLGGVCTYTTSNLKIDFTTTGNTGGIQAMNTTLANLGNLALVVPGLADQAFYNTNSASALFVLKGDAEYLFSMSDLNFQPLDPAVVQATEKSLAVKMLGNLP